MSGLRAVIFDFNGVIIDDEAVHLDLFRRVLGELGLGITDHEYDEVYLGFDDRGVFAAVLEANRRDASGEAVQALIARKSVLYNAWVAEEMPLFPGAVAFVQEAARQWPLAICSGALRGEIDLVLARAGIAECFGVIVSAEETTACKPDPQGYVIALERLRGVVGDDLRAEEVLVVEDSIGGLQAARAAGMRTLAVAHSYAAEQLAPVADLVAEGFDNVTDARFREMFEG